VVLAVEWVQIAILCERLSCLPSCGGLYDQDPGDVQKLRIVFNALDEKERADLKKAGSSSDGG